MTLLEKLGSELPRRYYLMECLESFTGAFHLQKVDSAFRAPSADEAARPGQC
jgi:hypothetical protein